MKYRLCLAIISFFLFCLPSAIARADNGPHGGYTATTDACAGCHRTHTAEGPGLLITSSVGTLCLTCHGTSATGADTNVSDGLYVSRDVESEIPPEGVDNLGLKGGGFDNAKMDSNLSGSATIAGTTSKHTYNDGSGVAWGNGAMGSGSGVFINLNCANCHNPHGGAGAGGSPTYRILRTIPYDSGAAAGVFIPDEVTKFYTIANANNNYYNVVYANADLISAWCTQCHTRYLAPSGSGHTDSGDSVFSYRHMSDHVLMSCMSCHVAHGTSAIMGDYSGSVPWPDGATTPNGNARSSLLRLDNRGVCQQCHGM